MADQLPAVVNRLFLAGPGGSVEVTSTKPKSDQKPLTYGQRHAAWRLGLVAVNQFLESKGFQSNLGFSTTKLGWSSNKVHITAAIREPGNIAYVTSRADYSYSKTVSKKDRLGNEMYEVKASVTTLKQELKGVRDVIAVDVSHEDGHTLTPIYVPLPESGEAPARYVYESVIDALATLADSHPLLRGIISASELREARKAKMPELSDKLRHDASKFLE